MRPLLSAAVGLVAALGVTAAMAQDLVLRGPSGATVKVTGSEIAALPRVSFRFEAHGQAHTFEGPLLIDVLAKAGAPTGKDQRGPALGHAVVVRARDGYTVVFGLAELDPATRSNRIILADKVDGAPVSTADGPFRIAAEGDLRPARGARMVSEIDVVNLRAATAPTPRPSP